MVMTWRRSHHRSVALAWYSRTMPYTPIFGCVAISPSTSACAAGPVRTSMSRCRKPRALSALASTNSWGVSRAVSRAVRNNAWPWRAASATVRGSCSSMNRFGLTTIFVTHDQNEADAMGHRVAVMRQGQIEQVGTYQELYHEPVNAFVAGFLGSPPMHLVAGWRAGDAIACEVSGTQIWLPFPVPYRTRVADG